MSRKKPLLLRSAMLTTALVVLDVVGIRLFDAFAVADQLFEGGAQGAVVAASTVLLLCNRLALYFVVPGYLLAALVYAIVARLALRRTARRSRDIRAIART